MKSRNFLGAAIAAILVFFTLAGNSCKTSQPPAPATPSSLNITINSWIGYGPLFIAKEKGLFDGLDVKVSFIDDGGARRSAMLSGQVDGYGTTVDMLALDATLGVAGKTVMCFDESAGADGIIAKSNVTWENMKGRKIAVQKGFPGHFLLLYLLKQHGLKPSDVELLDLDADKAGNAVVSGTVEVAVTWEPWISKAASLSSSKKLFTTAEQPGLIVDTLVIRDPVLQSRPDDVRRLIKGWFAAIDWYRSNPDEGNKIIASAFKLKGDEVGGMVSGVKFSDLKRNRELMGGSGTPGPINNLFDQASGLWKDAGVINSTVPATRYFDPAYLP